MYPCSDKRVDKQLILDIPYFGIIEGYYGCTDLYRIKGISFYVNTFFNIFSCFQKIAFI